MMVVSEIANVVTALAAAATALFAYLGLNSWRRQILENTQIQLAMELLTSTYGIQEVISVARGPFVSAGELAVIKQEAGEASSDRAYAYLAAWRRISQCSEKIAEWKTLVFRAKAVFGHQIASACEDIEEALREIQAASSTLASHGDQMSDESKQKLEAIIWPIRRDDPLGEKVTKAVHQIESSLTPIVRNV